MDKPKRSKIPIKVINKNLLISLIFGCDKYCDLSLFSFNIE